MSARKEIPHFSLLVMKERLQNYSAMMKMNTDSGFVCTCTVLHVKYSPSFSFPFSKTVYAAIFNPCFFVSHWNIHAN